MPTLFKRSNGVYYAVFVDDRGRRRWVSTGQRLKRLALKTLADQGNHPEKPSEGKRVQEFFDEFRAYAKTVYSDGTLEVYGRAFSAFLRHIGNIRLEALSYRQVDAFKSNRLSEVDPVTVNLELRTLRAAFYRATRWKEIGENPFKQVRLCRVDEETPTFLSRESFNQLLTRISQQWLSDLITLAACTGLRRGELVQLRWSDVDMGRRVLHVRSHGKFRTKNGKTRAVPLNPTAMSILLRRREDVEGEFVFNVDGRSINARYLSRAFKKAVRRAKLDERLHLHSLRHTFASWLVQGNASLYQVQKLLGHSSIRVTEMYSHLVPEDLRETVNKLPQLEQSHERQRGDSAI